MWLFLTGTFTSLVVFFAQVMTKKLAFTAATITVFIAITGSFKIIIEDSISAISTAYPTGAIGFGLSLLPHNTQICLTAMASAYVASIGYKLYRNFNQIQMVQTVR